MSGLLLGKIALITGAGSGIARATCQLMAKEGAIIIAADRNVQSAKDTVSTLSKDENHLSLTLDVGIKESINNAAQIILNQFNEPPSVIVNCAGITRDNFLLKLSEEDFDDVININLKGTFMVMQVFANMLIERDVKGASIINISSIVGKYGNIGQANYSASKAGVVTLTKTASKEFGKFGIRCNCILPGFINTPMTKLVPDKVIQKILPHIPSGRFGEANEIAEVITFLASEKSSYVNGAAIEVTGGF